MNTGGNIVYVKDVVPQHHGLPLCLTLAGVVANHLVHGVYTSISLVYDDFSFFLSAILVHHFAVMHCAQEHNSHYFIPDVADHGEAAIKSEFCAVNLPGFGSLYQRMDV